MLMCAAAWQTERLREVKEKEKEALVLCFPVSAHFPSPS